MVEDCAAGERLGWSEFVRDYSPITRQLLRIISRYCSRISTQHVLGVFERAHANGDAWSKGLKFQNEREYMMSYRELVFA